jgi:hypothetical protein
MIKSIKNFVGLIMALILFVISIPFWLIGFVLQVLLDAFNGGRNDWKNF